MFRAGSDWRKLFAAGCIVAILFCACNIIATAQNVELVDVSTMIKRGNLKEAEHRLDGYLQIHPRSVKANTLLGTVYLQQGRFDLAQSALQKAIAQGPTLLEPRVTLADAYGAAGKLDLA